MGFGKDIVTTGGGWSTALSTGPGLFDERARERVRRILEDGTPPNTRRGYASDLRYFWAWCSATGLTDEPIMPVPPEVIVRFVADHVEGLDPDVDEDLVARGAKARLGQLSIRTVERRVAALAAFHKAKRMTNPCSDPMVSQLMSKARKAAAKRGDVPAKKKAAVKTTIDAMIETCGEGSLLGVRDAALLLFGWASGGRRRSEIATATIDRLEAVGDNFVYSLGVTKTSQEGDGGTVPVTGRAAAALRRWIEDSGVTEGPIFRGVDRHGNVSKKGLCDRTVARIVQGRAKLAGFDPALYGGHSLRSGFITQAGLSGKGLLDAMALSRHKTMQVAAGYHQPGAALLNPTAGLADL